MAKKIVFPENKIRSFCKKHNIILMALFGSVLTSNFSAKSDVDILVQFKKNQGPNFIEFIDMEEELSEIIGRKVDLNTPNDLSRYFRDEVLEKAKVIYGRKRHSAS